MQTYFFAPYQITHLGWEDVLILRLQFEFYFFYGDNEKNAVIIMVHKNKYESVVYCAIDIETLVTKCWQVTKNWWHKVNYQKPQWNSPPPNHTSGGKWKFKQIFTLHKNRPEYLKFLEFDFLKNTFLDSLEYFTL